MKKSVLFGIAAGIAAAAVTAVAVKKISDEMKDDISEETFDSPFGDNWVTVSKGSSETAKGLTYVKVKAECDSKEDVCKLVFFTGKNAEITGEWEDDEHFNLLVKCGKYNQCCDISFSEKEITAVQYPMKAEIKL